MQKIKNEPRPKFTGSYKKKRVLTKYNLIPCLKEHKPKVFRDLSISFKTQPLASVSLKLY